MSATDGEDREGVGGDDNRVPVTDGQADGVGPDGLPVPIAPDAPLARAGDAPFITGPGFGTSRFALELGTRPAPPTASAREILRSRLPAIYHDGEFGMRFVGALEEVLDPIVALLDALPAHFSADLAPADVLELVTAWLGIELDEAQPTSERREIVRHASELGRLRGTRRGLELALALGFPSLPFRVVEEGAVVWARDPADLPTAPAPSFVVYCDEPIPQERQAAVARVIEHIRPVHVPYLLRVRRPGATTTEDG